MVSTKPRRGDVWFVDLGTSMGREQAGRGPAVVVSDNEMNDGSSGLVFVVPTTTSMRGLPSHIELDADDSGLDETSYVKCEDLRSISVERLVVKVGTASPVAMLSVDRALRFLLRL